jgi:hypothetical protein
LVENGFRAETQGQVHRRHARRVDIGINGAGSGASLFRAAQHRIKLRR